MRVDDDGARGQGKVLGAKGRLEHKLGGGLIKGGDGDRIPEHVVDPAQVGRLRQDRDAGIEHPQIMTVARPAHQPVLSEDDRLLIVVFGAMRHAEYGQGFNFHRERFIAVTTLTHTR